MHNRQTAFLRNPMPVSILRKSFNQNLIHMPCHLKITLANTFKLSVNLAVQVCHNSKFEFEVGLPEMSAGIGTLAGSLGITNER